MTKISVLNGPNLGMLGSREPEIYGCGSTDDLAALLKKVASDTGCRIDFQQHDSLGDLIAAINLASGKSQGLVINPGGFSHTSVALLDSMRAFNGPVVEVHVSQIHRREPYRHRMLTAQGADAVISGAGIHGYASAILTIIEYLRR